MNLDLSYATIEYRTAFFEGCFKLFKESRGFFWSNHPWGSAPEEIAPKIFHRTLDDAFYWATLWYFKYYKDTKKRFKFIKEKKDELLR